MYQPMQDFLTHYLTYKIEHLEDGLSDMIVDSQTGIDRL